MGYRSIVDFVYFFVMLFLSGHANVFVLIVFCIRLRVFELGCFKGPHLDAIV